MIEPTETETRETLDGFADAVAAILEEAAEDPEIARNAPYTDARATPGRGRRGQAARSSARRWTRLARDGDRAPRSRLNGRQGEPPVPRGDDVRRMGQHRSRRVDPRSSTARSTRASTSSTRPTSTRAGSPRRSSARRSPAAGATRWCSPPRCTAGWATIPTSTETRAAGSSRRSRAACAAWAPTGSTSTRSIVPSRTPTSTRRSGR